MWYKYDYKKRCEKRDLAHLLMNDIAVVSLWIEKNTRYDIFVIEITSQVDECNSVAWHHLTNLPKYFINFFL